MNAVRVAVTFAALTLTTATSAVVARPAHADDRPARTGSVEERERADRAVSLFERSAEAYRHGRFQEAVDLLTEARRIKPEPVLLYNLGRAYEALGRVTEAADAYAGYLKEDPNAPDRRAIEGRVATLRAQADQLGKARAAAVERPPAADPSAPAPTGSGMSPVPWMLLGVGAAGLGTGVVLWVLALDREDEALRDPLPERAEATNAEAKDFATGASVALVAGGAVAAVGAVWLVSELLSHPRAVRTVGGPGTLMVLGTF